MRPSKRLALLSLTIASVILRTFSSEVNCSDIRSRMDCLEGIGKEHCGYCLASGNCASRSGNDCPDGCLFFESHTESNHAGSEPTCHVPGNPTNTTTFNEDLATRYAKLAGAAYCSEENLTNWNCIGDKCINGMVPEGVAINKEYELVAYYGIDFGEPGDPTGPRVTIVFRGTVMIDIMNWVEDLDIKRVSPYLDSPKVKVHAGFFHAYSKLRSEIEGFLDEAPRYPLVIIGHSLGGAMGSICAYEIARQTNRYAFPGITLFTFGSPRVANLFFNQELGDMAVNSWRITHARDIVPHVPFQSLGFYHHSREVWFPDKQYVPGNYNICDGSGEDPVCQDSLWFATSVEDHLNYIGVQLGRGGCIFPGPGPVVDSWNVEAVDKR